jgi:hypothetical protein
VIFFSFLCKKTLINIVDINVYINIYSSILIFYITTYYYIVDIVIRLFYKLIVYVY